MYVIWQCLDTVGGQQEGYLAHNKCRYSDDPTGALRFLGVPVCTTVTSIISCCTEIQNGTTFQYQLTKVVVEYLCVCVYYTAHWLRLRWSSSAAQWFRWRTSIQWTTVQFPLVPIWVTGNDRKGIRRKLLLCISKSPTYLGRHVQAVERGSLWMDVKVTDSTNLVFSVTHMGALGNASTRCDKKAIP